MAIDWPEENGEEERMGEIRPLRICEKTILKKYIY